MEWIVRERLADRDARLKRIPIAIVPLFARLAGSCAGSLIKWKDTFAEFKMLQASYSLAE